MITVNCQCGARVRGGEARLRGHPPCPECGAALPDRRESDEGKPVPFSCMCGLKMEFPWRRGGLWFDCPECGRRSIIPGNGSKMPRTMAIDLPEDARKPAPSLVPLMIVLAAVAVLVTLGVVLLT
jgi:predicted RNA-binding Zn-ribbon protein involved in translation (DUF1610 family)